MSFNNLAVKWKLEGIFGGEFRTINNRCGVMAAWSRKTWKFVEQFLRLFVKTTPCGNFFQNSAPKVLPVHRSKLFCSNFVKCCRREIGEIVRGLPNQKNFGCLSNCPSLRWSRPNLPGPAPNNVYSQCSRFHPNPLTLGRVMAERVNTVFCPVVYFHYSPEAKRSFGRMMSFRALHLVVYAKSSSIH